MIRAKEALVLEMRTNYYFYSSINGDSCRPSNSYVCVDPTMAVPLIKLLSNPSFVAVRMGRLGYSCVSNFQIVLLKMTVLNKRRITSLFYMLSSWDLHCFFN